MTRVEGGGEEGRGALRRLGGKTVVVAAAVVVVVAATIGVLFLRDGDTPAATTSPQPRGGTPTPGTVGGQATGTLRSDFRNPRPFGSSQGPSVELDLTVTPARMAPGTRLSIVMKDTSRHPPGARSYSYVHGGGGPGIRFYPIPPAVEGTVPTGTGPTIPSKVSTGPRTRQPLPGGGSIRTATFTFTATIPDGRVLPPGRYIVSPIYPPDVTEVTIAGKKLSPAAVGAHTESALPVVTVLPAPSQQPPTSAN